nr:hypothetical protein I302_09197 [Kwoniella bestiolae CBS 10118]OCF21518.1 hypothetical protein I302_09197 [Kwoniella bestiolae CBS 10118]
MTGPAASDATLSPSVRSLSPISPLPNVPTFCLTPYPEQTEFPESLIVSPVTSPKQTDPQGTLDDMASRLRITQEETNNTVVIPRSNKPPTPRRRVTSPSFLIPPSLKMSSLTSTIPSPTNPPPLSPHGRAKAPFARPRIGRSATISSNSLSTSTSKRGVWDDQLDVGTKRKPEPLILQRPVYHPTTNGDTAGTMERTKSTSILNLLSNSSSSQPQTPIPLPLDHETRQNQDQSTAMNPSSSKTAKPLTSRRIGGEVNQDRWYTEQDLKPDMEEPRLGRELSPGWGEFEFDLSTQSF